METGSDLEPGNRYLGSGPNLARVPVTTPSDAATFWIDQINHIHLLHTFISFTTL